MKEFADGNSEYGESHGKFSRRVENTHYEQFLLFLQSFQNTCTADTCKQEIISEKDKFRFNPYKTTKFGLFHSERVCRRHFYEYEFD